MTIDDVIKHYKDNSKCAELKLEVQFYTQMVEWLEELKKLREGRKENPIVTITINKKDLQKMVDEKVKDIELDIQGIRNKAIDDFADKIREKIEISMIPRANELETIQALEELMSYSIGRIAERLKEGDTNGYSE